MKDKTGGPAFPTNDGGGTWEHPETGHILPQQYGQSGMTLRDYFAASAMNGLVSSKAFHGPIYQQQATAAAEFAYLVADAMLAAREAP